MGRIIGIQSQYLYLGDNKRRSVGQKRNDLMFLAQGDYIAFIDDDDMITEDYVTELLKAAQGGADVVCFKVLFNSGRVKKEVVYNPNFLKDKDKSKVFERLPNHIMMIKRRLALSVGFQEKNFGEDKDFSTRLKPLIRSHSDIDRVLYYYNFSHQTSETQ